MLRVYGYVCELCGYGCDFGGYVGGVPVCVRQTVSGACMGIWV